MCRRLRVLTCLTFLIGISLADTAHAGKRGLAGWWKLDETSGAKAADSSDNGNDGTLEGDVHWTEGVLGGAWEGDGTGDYIRVPHSDSLDLSETATVAMWLYGGIGPDMVICKGNDGSAWQASFGIRMDDAAAHAREINWRGRVGNTPDSLNSNTALPTTEWSHLAVTFNVNAPGNNQKIYINGVLDAESRSTTPLSTNTADLLIGADGYSTTRWHWQGKFDDIRLYSLALEASQISSVMAGGGLDSAFGAAPANEATDVPRDTELAWSAGDNAVTHDVYFGTAFDNVNDASRDNPMGVLVSQGQTETTYHPGRLELSRIYYWRVDEVAGAPDYTVYKGQTWSFTVEPFAYAVENIVATSNTTYSQDQGPEKLVDGSGLNENDQHSTSLDAMWLGSPIEGQSPYVQFEFDRVYKLYEMIVWNYNMAFEFALGLGVKDATIEYSLDGVDWTILGDVQLAQGESSGTYTPNTTVAFEGVGAKYVRLAIASSWMSTSSHGLSEIRFMYIPAHAREPKPADGATNVSMDAELTWRAGRDVVGHEVYLGHDPDALDLFATPSQNGVSAALDVDTTYYWRVDETDADGTWEGPVWTFSTQEYIGIDNFEAYDHDIDAGTTIWQTWIDGLEDTANGGSMVGNDPSPFAERTIVHSGRQSMPLYFTNDSASAISETDLKFDSAQDWSVRGIKSLSLWFYGVPGNAGRLYVKINETKVLYDGAASDIARAQWQPWNIDLAAAGNVSHVTSISIGMEGVASGVIYIDDVRLYGKAVETVTPVEPDTAGLLAYYPLDGNLQDASGNGRNGTFVGGAAFAPGGQSGQAVSFNGIGACVDLGPSGNAGQGFNFPGSFSLCAWINIEDYVDAWGHVIFANRGEGTPGYQLRRYSSTMNLTFTMRGTTGADDPRGSLDMSNFFGEWVQVTAVYNAEAGTRSVYVNGLPDMQMADSGVCTASTHNVYIGARATADNTDQEKFFRGMIDEVRFYNRALTEGEILHLAGRTEPRHLEF